MTRVLVLTSIMLACALAANPLRPAARGHFTPEPSTDDFRVGFWDSPKFDPLTMPSPLPGAWQMESYPGDGTGWYLVQFRGPVRQQQLSELERTGARFLGFHSRLLAFVKMDAAKAAPVGGLSFVRWVGIYQPGYKFHSQVLVDDGYGRVAVALFYPEDVSAAVQDLEALGCAVVRTGETDIMKVIEVDCRVEVVPEIARLGWVMAIEEWHPAETENVDAQWVVQDWSQNQRRVWSQGVFGEDEVLGYTDTGLDVNHYAFRDPGVPLTDTGEFPTHRKVVVFKHHPAAGGVGDPDGHGTHVAGTIAGNDSVNGGTNLNDGHSRSARIVHLSPIPQPPGNDFTVPLNVITNNLRNPSLRPRTISNSWWTGTMGQYTMAASSFDQFSWKNRDIQTIKSCGNQGQSGQYRITEPGNSKSVISCAALENGTGATQLASFSSRGPAPDGRVKPDISVPGNNIYSAQSGSSNGYVSMGGTSMAAPCVNGSIGLLRSYLRKGYYPSGSATPADTWGYVSSAILKAMVLVSADPNIGSYVIPSEYVGWGRLDLDSVLYFPADVRRLLCYDDTTGLATGAYQEFRFEVSDSIPLRACVVWTDTAAASGANPALINNLDCRLTAPNGDTFRGSVYATGQSVRNPTQAYNNRDPQELFRVNRPEPGPWMLRVSAQNVVTARQPHAVVITGAVGMGERHDVGVAALIAPADTVDSGLVVTPRVTVRNHGTAEETFPVWMFIGAGYSDSVEVTLASGATDTVDFAAWEADSVGSFDVVSLTGLAGDENPANDTATGLVVVWPPTGIAAETGLPTAFSLDHVLPNPFAGATVVRFGIPHPVQASVSIYSATGALIRVVCSASLAPARYSAVWDGRDGAGRAVGRGIYYCRMQAGDFRAIRKLVKLN